MERISGSQIELRYAANLEISKLELTAEDKVIAYFSESPSILGYPFKITLIEKSDGSITSNFKQWDTEYDLSRWDNGIYNLDRLKIITKKLLFSQTEKREWEEHISVLKNVELPRNLNNDSFIVLDGSDFSLGLNFGLIKTDYKWKVATESIKLFESIIEFLMKRHTVLRRH